MSKPQQAVFVTFTAQCIIVRINHWNCNYRPFYSPERSYWIFKDLLLLDRVVKMSASWSQYSFILGKRIHRSVRVIHDNLSSFDKPILIFLLGTWLAQNGATTLTYKCVLTRGSHKFRRVHGREYPSDGLDRSSRCSWKLSLLGSRHCLPSNWFVINLPVQSELGFCGKLSGRGLTHGLWLRCFKLCFKLSTQKWMKFFNLAWIR